MAVEGVHYLALSKAKDRYAATEAEFAVAKQRLDEAIKLGDLSENAEYDTAKSAVNRLSRELDELSPVVTMSPVHANEAVSIIEEGSVVEVIIHSITHNPVPPGSAAFGEAKEGTPAFKGHIMFGASLSFHELLNDHILAASTPVGKYILGKQPGDYSVPVPAGFANLSVRKLEGRVKTEDLYCTLGGGKSNAGK